MVTRYDPPSRRVPPDRKYLASLTWETMDAIREMAGLPFMLKGVQTAEDAEIAVQHGVDVLAVSVAPGEDTRHSVRRFLSVQHAGGFLRYLSGTRAQLAPVWKRYGIAPQRFVDAVDDCIEPVRSYVFST